LFRNLFLQIAALTTIENAASTFEKEVLSINLLFKKSGEDYKSVTLLFMFILNEEYKYIKKTQILSRFQQILCIYWSKYPAYTIIPQPNPASIIAPINTY